MKFLYEYNTKENERRQGEVFAATRDAAFRELREKGIKPFNMKEAPGFLNKLLGKGKRWIAIALLAAACVALAVFVVRDANVQSVDDGLSSTPRHQVYGDPALLHDIEERGFGDVFANEGDRVLAAFARPGVYVRRATGGERMQMVNALAALSAAEVPQVRPDDVREVAEFKRIVLGMREELNRYLSVGTGTPESYLRRLYERQEREVALLSRAQADLRNEKNPQKFERINKSLRAMGLRTILSPEAENDVKSEVQEK